MLFSIRSTFEDDELAVLYEIEKECFAKEFRWAEPIFKRALLSARKQNFVWVAFIGTRIAGFLLAGDENGKASIETCNVARAHRRKGVASKLIAACERDLKKRGYNEIKLEVWTENPAQLLYFELGYRACGFKRNYYRLHAHAISMSKKLS
jgi:ribosomal protein S18 acetylase RimI-like enzyme